MFPAQKNKHLPDWQPSASIETLRKRAQILNLTREFFASRNVMEVETPLLGSTSVTDPHIQSIPAFIRDQFRKTESSYYLQTSPEYMMKRLLVAGSGPIYQITKALRQEENGRLHNPEFTILEWYRPDFDHHDLMNEVDALLQWLLKTPVAEKKTYQAIFQTYLNIDPHHTTCNELMRVAELKHLSLAGAITDIVTGLNLLMTHCIEPNLGKDRPCFVYDYPASQAALAKSESHLAARFEVYVQGIELGNGFHELQDVNEHCVRFQKNLLERKKLGLESMTIDEAFLAALTHGLPECAGVALGLDRVVMLAAGKKHIAEVLSFDFTRV